METEAEEVEAASACVTTGVVDSVDASLVPSSANDVGNSIVGEAEMAVLKVTVAEVVVTESPVVSSAEEQEVTATTVAEELINSMESKLMSMRLASLSAEHEVSRLLSLSYLFLLSLAYSFTFRRDCLLPHPSRHQLILTSTN